MRKPLLFIWCLCAYATFAQDGYQTPPKPLADLITAPPTPTVSVDSKGQWMLISERNTATTTIAELSQPEYRIAGLRINPATNGPSRAVYVNNLKLRQVSANPTDVQVTGLPTNPQISSIQWSPDDSKIAFTHTTDTKIQLYVVDVATAVATKVSDVALNAVLGVPYQWLSDSKSFIVRGIPAERGAAPEISRVPSGPTVQENLGTKAQAATYQDLLKSPADEKQFEYYATAQTMKLGLDGSVQKIGNIGLIATAAPSPDGRYVMIESIHRPFSYLVTVNRFPSKIDIFDAAGALVKTLTDIPLQENVPWGQDAAPSGQRNHNWRNDAPATVYWVEAKDGGDPKRKIAIRDVVYTLDAPFSGEAKEIYAAAYRFGGVTWGNDQTALFSERWNATRKIITKLVNPSNPANPVVLFDRSSEDRYNNPGTPELKKNAYGEYVLDITAANEIYLTGQGASPEGDRPFVDVYSLTTKQAKRLFRSEAPFFERPISILNAEKGLILTSRESQEEQPNYFIRNLKPALKKGKKAAEPALTQVTFFPHPYPQFKGIQKQQLRYKRPDGVDLTAMLLLPPGYKKEDGPLPTFLWAYPAEFKNAAAAGQVNGSPYQFNRISYWTGAAFVTMGYAVLENASIPIVGEGDNEPNDTYVEQLVASAKAAIDEGVRLGVVDASRVGVGGHSYGAFMTANLLSHSNLFRAGIARSGAYNRTLTPFGFQNEQRTYWQAPDVYNKMSPFMNVDKVKTPLLLTHGEADNNTGTFPIQSERYYNALKGMGATAKLVFLPYESHGYTAKESLLHMLYEMNGWLDKYVKNAPATPPATKTGQMSGEKR
ncbi:prolyl oligopeptidase family serine peptidase [Runella sp. CRIBMP]|uniref:S9 family peptidase n=1 Tax=Runella sp. CRIBMP TaxID=2683261 RepID=UPI001411D819|nr:prolyl oligopeptidase family serine peptidase [Runella sp. CRIBMP]NBB20533.1 prolyl oligopeptidase family serine peptidase [Runella sp. CRIBMP]